MGAIQTITAAAARIVTRKSGSKEQASTTGLAAVAWDLWETIPEVGTYADWISNAMSGATLFAGRRLPDGTVEKAPAGSRPAELVAGIAGGPDGQAVMLGKVGIQYAVPGEFWQVIIPGATADRWEVLSTEEVTRQRDTMKATVDGDEITIPPYNPDKPDPLAPAAFRVWKPSPRRHLLATSPVLRSITVLEELRLLSAAVAAIARSRLTGRGILLVPAGARFPTQPGQDAAEDSLLDTFIEIASTAIREPESAAATVPIVLEIPGDLISGVKWLEFSSEFDARAQELRDEAIRRFATGADVPAEVLLGLGDTNHWGAWAITAEALRLGIEPKLREYCQALTSEWLRPILQAERAAQADEWLVWYDTSGLRSASNKAANALEAYKEGLISASAARRELGFTEADAPGAADAPAADDTPAPAAEGNDLPVSATESIPEQTPAPLNAAAVVEPTILDSFTAQTDAALAAAVDGLVWSALSVAGQKLRHTAACPRAERNAARGLLGQAALHTRYPVPDRSAITHWRLMDDAWARVPEVAARYGIDPARLTAALDEYVTALLIAGQPHEFDSVPRLLARMRWAETPCPDCTPEVAA